MFVTTFGAFKKKLIHRPTAKKEIYEIFFKYRIVWWWGGGVKKCNWVVILQNTEFVGIPQLEIETKNFEKGKEVRK